MEMALGGTPDLSALLQFKFYEPVYYHDPIGNKFPETTEKIGYFVGIAENKGDELTFWVLTGNGSVIARYVIRTALKGTETNKREGTGIDQGLEGRESTDTGETNEDSLDLLLLSEKCKSKMPVLDPNEVKGFVFVRDDSKGIPTRATVSRFDDEIEKYLLKY